MLLTPETIKQLQEAVQSLQRTLTSMSKDIIERNSETYSHSYVIWWLIARKAQAQGNDEGAPQPEQPPTRETYPFICDFDGFFTNPQAQISDETTFQSSQAELSTKQGFISDPGNARVNASRACARTLFISKETFTDLNCRVRNQSVQRQTRETQSVRAWSHQTKFLSITHELCSSECEKMKGTVCVHATS